MSKHWIITLEEADDGSGDLIMPFPENFLEGTGWNIGDTLEWIDNKNGSFTLRKKDDDTA